MCQFREHDSIADDYAAGLLIEEASSEPKSHSDDLLVDVLDEPTSPQPSTDADALETTGGGDEARTELSTREMWTILANTLHALCLILLTLLYFVFMLVWLF